MPRFRATRGIGLHQPQVNEHHLQAPGLPDDGRLRLLSFNIQVGISTERYRHYLTRSWQHLLPHNGRAGNLQKIGKLLSDFDLVALQEADGGSLRSGFVNQVEHLAQLGAFPYWYQQLNRNLGRFAQHSNGVLSRLKPQLLEDHPLPGPAGRGAILVRFGEGEDALIVVMMHLALGAKTRALQLGYIRELIGGYRHQVLMGDMNTHATDLLEHSPLRDLGLVAPQVEATFPSWRPQRCLDHILLSSSLTLERVEVLAQPISDHLPVAVEIRLPDALTVDTLPALS
ncbi:MULTISPECIES: endonuclease/exonuclease/phosphatase family protein [Pseudomonas]|jgi:endonuclease/exonuclease/phosphatase family metal-dependent hydrolase|uniref:Endonuclease/exonuclease/phosphatase family protein n=1 Tax=Pseudomonas juntendi TaxID=2666183 RepID=A0A7W2KGP1_9PSED|nr:MULTISPECIES: endonuclease/exonuclease/phosphatase family protein [Pseudomonas]QOH72430.1 endonuclease/exonuclease/phosphatase family protein [Pseudomonas putida]MBA6098183.1 endonuclease/exonuclease/phosphatase family protein [Pseudomonas juntendi]MBA6132967.1 endonuclease/exonuclease/phosphatase family protein [Pseudomonas juntendi]MBA6148320.1 endonuclease/exonuclease/phosphatase family protein [Pseudomonas juntendi]MBH3374170.1 endonuclease/exonuclease/phosphatase family protein [Pseudo